VKGADGHWAAAEEVADTLEEAGAEDEEADGIEWLVVRNFPEILCTFWPLGGGMCCAAVL